MIENLHEFKEILYTKTKPSDSNVTMELLETIIKTASLAPSGANMQPWTYVLEDKESHLILTLFKQNFGVKGKEKIKHYYAHLSTSLSAGFLITALKYCGIDFKIIDSDNIHIKRPIYEKPIFRVSINKTVSSYSFKKALKYHEQTKKRRSVRVYDKKTFDKDVLIESINFVGAMFKDMGLDKSYIFTVIEDPRIKQEIRKQAEINEKRLYEELISKEWEQALKPLGTNWKKEHLTDAPYLIVVFSKIKDQTLAGLATGILIQILHFIGLSTLTYTPSPMDFVCNVLKVDYSPLMILPVGFKGKDYLPPTITKKDISEVFVKI